MKKPFLCLVLLVPIFCFGESRMERDEHPIIGGSPLQSQEAPWLAWVVIPKNNEQAISCTGSLIDPYWVLTAAHCFDESNGDPALVKFGEFIGTGETRSSRAINLHPDYDFHAYDVALIELDRPVHVDPIPLSLREPIVNDPVTLMGFGKDETGNSPVSTARKGDATALLWSFCADHFPMNVEQVCVGSGAFVGVGDSGGPLLVRTGQDHWNQIGVIHTLVSSRAGAPSFGGITIATKVSAIHEWLSEYTSIHRDDDLGDTDSPQDPPVQDVPREFLESVSKHWVIPTSVNSPGRFGGIFKTSLILWNSHRDKELTVTASLYGSKGLVDEKPIQLKPMTYSNFPNFLENIFDYQGGGALELTSPDPFSVSRVEVYIDTDSGRNITVVSALPFPLRPYSTPTLALGVTVNEDYRTNIGVFNASPSRQVIMATIYRPSNKLQEIKFDLPAKSWSQKSISVQLKNGFVIWNSPNDLQSYYPYIVEVDNESQDGTLTYPIPLSE